MAGSNSREILREFLMSLGFEVKSGEYNKFLGAIQSISKQVALAGTAVMGLTVGTEEMVRSFAGGMEKLFYASQRTKASVANIQALRYGAEQVGVSAEEATSTLEAFSQILRTSPGKRGLLDQLLGHSTAKEDRVTAMLELVTKLSTMPHYIGAQFAQMFGMDEQTFTQFVNNKPQLEAAMKRRLELNKQGGIDAQQAAAASREYQNEIRQLTAQLDVLWQKVAIKLLPYFKELIDELSDGTDKLMGFSGAWKVVGRVLRFIMREVVAISHVFGGLVGALFDLASGDFSGAWKQLLGVAKSGQTEIDAFKDLFRKEPAAPASGNTVGSRLNNPGNLRSWAGVPTEGGFAHFSSMKAGLGAMAQQLLLYSKRGKDTIRSIISTYAPSSENNTASYIADVAKRMGISPDAHLNLSNPETLSSLMSAMVRHEQGYMPVSSKDIMMAAQSKINGQGATVIHQTNNINVSGGNTHEIATAVKKAIHDANSTVIRNHAGAIS